MDGLTFRSEWPLDRLVYMKSSLVVFALFGLPNVSKSDHRSVDDFIDDILTFLHHELIQFLLVLGRHVLKTLCGLRTHVAQI